MSLTALVLAAVTLPMLSLLYSRELLTQLRQFTAQLMGLIPASMYGVIQIWTAASVIVCGVALLWLPGAIDRKRTRSQQEADRRAWEQQRQEAKERLVRRLAEWDALPPREKARRRVAAVERERKAAEQRQKEAELRKLAAELAPYLEHEDRTPAGRPSSARDGDVGNGAGTQWWNDY